ncbi:phage tail family protein, partial [Bacillus cereus]|nr:phage tail family protein [Bacillus cereus]
MIIFNGIDIIKHFDELFDDGFLVVNDIRGRSVSNNEVQTLSVPHRDGAYFLNARKPTKSLEVDISIKGSKLRKRIDELNNVLSVNKPVPIIFTDEPEFTYYGIPESISENGEIGTFHKVTISFLRTDPIKYGPLKSVDFENDGQGLIANVKNKGSVHSNPIIEIDIIKPHTFLDVWFEDKYSKEPDYFRIGVPLKMEQLPVERNQRLIWDEMSTTVGWSKVSSMEDGNPVGEMKTDSYQFYCSDYGSGNGWHGAAVKKSIPGGPVQDFIMQAHVTCKSKKINEMGRVEIAILDENSKVLSKIAMNDHEWQAEQK